MKKSLYKLIILVLVLIIVYVIIPKVIIEIKMSNRLLLCVSNDEWSAWIGYIGSALGGLLTLCGVYITLEYNKKATDKAYSENLQLINEQLRLKKLPLLEIVMLQNDEIIPLDCDGNVFNIYNGGGCDIAIKILIKNIGENIAKNIEIQTIYNDVCDLNVFKLCDYVKQADDYIAYINLHFNEKCLTKNRENKYKFILFFEDALGNRYKKEFYGYVHTIAAEIEQNKLYISITNNSGITFTKVKYYFIPDEEKENRKKYEKMLKEADESIIKMNEYKYKEELDELVVIFKEIFFYNMISNVASYLQKLNYEKFKEEFLNGCGGGEMLISFKEVTNRIVEKTIKEEIFSGKLKLKFKVSLKINLDKKTIKIYNFKIEESENIDFIKCFKIHFWFRNKIIKCEKNSCN